MIPQKITRKLEHVRMRDLVRAEMKKIAAKEQEKTLTKASRATKKEQASARGASRLDERL